MCQCYQTLSFLIHSPVLSFLLQFLCIKNIRWFLNACRVHFSMKTSELFDIYDLFELKDFKKVSLSPEATCPQRLPVPRGYLSSKLSTCPQSYPPVHRAMSQDLLAPHRVQQGQEPWYFHRHRMCVLFKHLRPIQFKHLRPILSSLGCLVCCFLVKAKFLQPRFRVKLNRENYFPQFRISKLKYPQTEDTLTSDVHLAGFLSCYYITEYHLS